MRYILLLCSLFMVFSCSKSTTKILQKGQWRATLAVQDSLFLPFIFEVKNDSVLNIFNADEVIAVDEVFYKNDSVIIQTPVFEGYIKAKIENDSTLLGHYIKPQLDRVVPFKAKYGNADRFEAKTVDAFNVTGQWETTFSPDTDKASKAKGIFTQQGQKVTGTFRTTTGDYRFLEGIVDGSTLKLSTFDGAHAYLFTAEVTDSTLSGMFYSGNHFKEPFVAKRNETFQLADADTLTFLKPGYDKLSFAFPDEHGNIISLNDEQFKNKVVIVQLMGTWCPNCLDETKYFVEYLKTHPNQNLAFVGIAFEYAKTDEQAFKSISRLKERLGIPYPILLAQTGSTSKKAAQEKLPMLNHVLSYPTAIYIDASGNVRKIHTGFNGPATGEMYTEYKREFESFISELLAEKN